MFQSLVVYLSLGILMVLLCRYYAKFPNGKHNYLMWALVVYSIVFGLRYGVGADYFGYKEIYDYYYTTGKPLTNHLELGFIFLVDIFCRLRFNYVCFFAIFAFLQIYFLFKSIRDNTDIVPYMAYTFMASCVCLVYLNEMRQELAFCIFAYCLPFIIKKKWLPYFFFCSIASLIHTSGVLLFLFYPILVWKNEWIKNIKIQILLLGISLILMKVDVVFQIIPLIDEMIKFTPYASYFDMTSNRMLNKMSMETSLGIGFYLATLIIFIEIIYSNKVKEYFKNSVYTVAYNMFYIGVLWKNVFVSSQIFQRVNYYLYGFSFLIGAFTLAYLYKKNQKIFYILAILYFMVFVGYMSNIDNNFSKYYFIWQKSSYIMPNV